MGDHKKVSTFGVKVSDSFTDFIGSWRGFFFHVLVITSWMAFNGLGVTSKYHFDPFPFIFLNLALSTEAAVGLCFILMSQNRQAIRDRSLSENIYVIDLETKLKLTEIVGRLDQMQGIETPDNE